MPITSLRSFGRLHVQARWLMWLALWLIAEYALRLWTAAPMREPDSARP